MSAGAPRRALFSSILESRKICAFLVGAGALHVALAASELGGWPCPFRAAMGWPCPGCGLGLACAALLRGEVGRALRLHAFAPVVLAGMGVLFAGCVLPEPKRAALLSAVAKGEERTRCAAAFAVAILIYWVVRLGLDGPHFLPLRN